MSDTLKCGTHGEREARYVCDHLYLNQRLGAPRRLPYYEPERVPGEPTPAIWCEACEAVVQAEGEINQVVHAYADWHAVCDFCFQRFLDQNVPALTEDAGGTA